MIDGDINGVVDSSGEWLNILLAILIFGNFGLSNSATFFACFVSGFMRRTPSSLTAILFCFDVGGDTVPKVLEDE